MLNPKQERFCQEYVIDLNGTQAAIRAGYSERSARQIADQNLSKLDIQNKIKELQSEIGNKLGVDAAWIISRLKEVAERCMTAEPVMTKVNGESIESGEYKFDASGANRALELLGKHVGIFEKDNEQKDRSIVVKINETT